MSIFNFLFGKKKQSEVQKKHDHFMPTKKYSRSTDLAAENDEYYRKIRKQKQNDSSSDLMNPLNPLSPLWYGHSDMNSDNYVPPSSNNDNDFKGFGGGDFGGGGAGGSWGSGSSHDSGSSSSYDSGSSDSGSSSCDSGSSSYD